METAHSHFASTYEEDACSETREGPPGDRGRLRTQDWEARWSVQSPTWVNYDHAAGDCLRECFLSRWPTGLNARRAARVVVQSQKKQLMMWEALREATDEEMERDPTVCVMGERWGKC